MKAPQLGVIGATIAAIVVVALAAIGTPDRRVAAPPPPAAPMPMTRVAANGFALTSVAVDLPEDPSRYPDGPHVAAVEANCSACHSPSMVLTQPPLSREQWQATVTKMREVYHAPIADAAVPAILIYLEALGSTGVAGGVAGDVPTKRTVRDQAR